MMEMAAVELWMGGIDTVSTIKVNDKTIGDTNNMYRRYVMDVKSAIKVNICMLLLILYPAKLI